MYNVHCPKCSCTLDVLLSAFLLFCTRLVAVKSLHVLLDTQGAS